MPLKLISNFVTSYLRRSNESEIPAKEALTTTSGHQKSTSLASLSFSPTITIQGLWNKKDDQSDISTVKSSAENERWVAHQEQLEYWQSQPPAFDPYPSLGIQDYQLLETLGWLSWKFRMISSVDINDEFFRNWYFWKGLVIQAE